MLPLVLATEVWLLALNRPYHDRRRRQRAPYRELWRVRIMWTGLAPVYMKGCIQAILGGPNRKPVYKVTRKHDDVRWHWRQTLPQTTVVLAVLAVAVYGVRFGTLPNLTLLAGTAYWGGLNVVLLGGFVARGWYGVRWLRRWTRPASPDTGQGAPSPVREAG
jgi:hypothetical protein